MAVSEGQCVSPVSLRLCYEAEGLTVLYSCSLQHHGEVEQADKTGVSMCSFWMIVLTAVTL